MLFHNQRTDNMLSCRIGEDNEIAAGSKTAHIHTIVTLARSIRKRYHPAVTAHQPDRKGIAVGQIQRNCGGLTCRIRIEGSDLGLQRLTDSDGGIMS